MAKRTQHWETIEAEVTFPICRASRQPEPEPGERQRSEVSEHVAGICEQGQGDRHDAAGDLDKHEGASNERCQSHAPLVVGVSRVMIMTMAGVAMVVTMVQMRSHGDSHPSLARVEG